MSCKLVIRGESPDDQLFMAGGVKPGFCRKGCSQETSRGFAIYAFFIASVLFYHALSNFFPDVHCNMIDI